MHVDRFGGEIFGGPGGAEAARARAEAQNTPQTREERRVDLLATALRRGDRVAEGTDAGLAAQARQRAFGR
jgi:hypothetical protein